jgi:hypothetical protein
VPCRPDRRPSAAVARQANRLHQWLKRRAQAAPRPLHRWCCAAAPLRRMAGSGLVSRRRLDQPASAGLGTEPGRSRPGDRGEGRWSRRCQCRERWPVGHDRLPRQWRGRARRRLAPTRWDDPSPIGDRGISVMRDPRPVGVRRCLTRRPGRAGHHHVSCGWSRSGERCRHRDALPHGAALVRSGRGSASLPPGRVPPPRGRVVARLGSRRPLSGRGRRCRTPERRVALPQRPAAQDTRQGTGCPLALGPRLLERGDEWPDRPLVATLPGQRLDEQRFDSGG